MVQLDTNYVLIHCLLPVSYENELTSKPEFGQFYYIFLNLLKDVRKLRFEVR